MTTRIGMVGMRRWLCVASALILFALTAGDIAACSMVTPPSVQIQCNGTTVVVEGFDPQAAARQRSLDQKVAYLGSQWDRQRAVDELDGACGDATAELYSIIPESRLPGQWPFGKLEWFLSGGITLIFEPWSPAREAGLLRQQEQFSLRDCGSVAFARDGDWLKHIVQMQPYCYEVGGGGGCPSTYSSPTLFLPFLLKHFHPGVALYLLPYLGLFSLLFGIGAWLYRRGDLFAFFVPTRFRLMLIVVVGFILFQLGYLFDLVPALVLCYLAVGLVEYLRTHVFDRRAA